MIKKIIVTLFLGILSQNILAATPQCFIAKENGKIVKQLGECNGRHTPASTFKIPLAVMGFDSGILQNADNPLVPFSDEAKANFMPLYLPEKYPIQRFSIRAQTPASWMTFSVVWYSQYITQKLGYEKFQDYVNKFNYGNKDISGHPGKNDGLLSSWIFSSLQISPVEQLNFIEKLQKRKLPVSLAAQENTIRIIALDNLWDNWTLHGKTGGGMTAGWFIGFIEKDKRAISFVQYVEPENALISGGLMAKEMAKNNLISLMLKDE